MRKQKLQNLESDKHSAKHFFTDKQNMLNIVLLKSSQIKSDKQQTASVHFNTINYS